MFRFILIGDYMTEDNFNTLVQEQLDKLIHTMKKIRPNHEATELEISKLKSAAEKMIRNRLNGN